MVSSFCLLSLSLWAVGWNHTVFCYLLENDTSSPAAARPKHRRATTDESDDRRYRGDSDPETGDGGYGPVQKSARSSAPCLQGGEG
eukprot:scaffold35215_cov42-Phaeocystis_antarctica.AAC.1